MFICICNAVTDKDIRQAARAGAKDLWALQEQLGVATNCGSCSQDALAIVEETHKAARKPARPARFPQPVIYTPATSQA